MADRRDEGLRIELGVLILPIGPLDTKLIEALAARLKRVFREVIVLPRTGLPPESHDRPRKQFLASALLDLSEPPVGAVLLGVTGADLFIPDLNFVFGVADRLGRTSVISYSRLTDPDMDRVEDRMVKEAVHEIGHLLGLDHCRDRRCVMHFSNSLPDTDFKNENLCAICSKMIWDRGELRETVASGS